VPYIRSNNSSGTWATQGGMSSPGNMDESAMLALLALEVRAAGSNGCFFYKTLCLQCWPALATCMSQLTLHCWHWR
jgi:hypothetical protein